MGICYVSGCTDARQETGNRIGIRQFRLPSTFKYCWESAVWGVRIRVRLTLVGIYTENLKESH